MKEVIRGDMMEIFDKVDHFIICVGSKLRAENNELIMLNGLSGVLGTKYPTLKEKMGAWIADNCGSEGEFYLRVSGKVGMLQHVRLARQGLDISVLSTGLILLAELAEANPGKTYAVEWPGTSQTEKLANQMIDRLPANVEVWRPES